jgi:mannosyl-oligosaccharide alpha-1,2-mannosidase
MADSAYEYLPKEYALLGGLNSQYKSMYMDAMDVVREKLLFRPMTKDNRDILFPSKHHIASDGGKSSQGTEIKYEGSHLGCFAGGMFALGSKLFDLPGDMVIAEKLTDGCVWAYESMPVGVMAESFEIVPCDSLTSCAWDEKKWHDWLDPFQGPRMQAVEAYNADQKRLHAVAAAHVDRVMGEEEQDTVAKLSDPSSRKRSDASHEVDRLHARSFMDDDAADEDQAVLAEELFVPKVALSHDKYVATRILEERLPPGYTKIKARDYRLRPEAIESVFVMYRITGDESWREKGWKMFTAVERATKTEIAHAAIRDVTSVLMEQDDSMESFWLAETLKYYYLLFSEPDLISLDDYVL